MFNLSLKLSPSYFLQCKNSSSTYYSFNTCSVDKRMIRDRETYRKIRSLSRDVHRGSFLPQVLRKLKTQFGDMYTERNVMISGTHTHSAPGGFMLDVLFDLTTFGFVRESFDAIVNGITKVSVDAQSLRYCTTVNDSFDRR